MVYELEKLRRMGSLSAPKNFSISIAEDKKCFEPDIAKNPSVWILDYLFDITIAIGYSNPDQCNNAGI